MQAYPKLFTPGKIGKLEIKNRIVKAPQSTGLSNMDGTVSEKLVRHYKELARGGAGMIIVEYTYIDNDASKSAYCQLGISQDEHIAGLSWLASTIQDYGTIAGIQLEHCGRQRFLGTLPIKAPSRIPWPILYEQTGIIPEELTIEEIKQIIKDFGAAAKRAQTAGFDFIEIHAAHGYLITNFLSPHTNKRTDLYGGSLENRMRFLTEVIQSVKENVGDDFPVTMRINGTDYEPDGIPIEESIEVCKIAEKLGISALHVSGGDHHMMNYQVSPMSITKGPNVWASEAIRNEVSIPTIASGSITTPRFAEEIISGGKGDYVSLGRPLLADPYFPKKAEEGRAEDIIPCIRCNDGCMERTFWNFRSIRCSVNPNMGREGELPIEPTPYPKRILVIGGGPAGMEAARVSALRGHDVTLYEKEELGGSLISAGGAAFKSDINHLQNYYTAQMKKLDIDIVYEEATADTINKGHFNEVIVSIGKTSKKFMVDGMDKIQVAHANNVLSNQADVGKNVVIVGGGLTGVEAALHLADQGKSVTIVEKMGDIMRDDLDTFKTHYEEMLKQQKVSLEILTELKEVKKDRVQIVSKDGNRKEIIADSLVVANGYKNNKDFANELEREMKVKVHSIGDGERLGEIYDAVHAGYLTGLSI